MLLSLLYNRSQSHTLDNGQVETDWHVQYVSSTTMIIRLRPHWIQLLLQVSFYCKNFRETPTRLTWLCVANHLKRNMGFTCAEKESQPTSRARATCASGVETLKKPNVQR